MRTLTLFVLSVLRMWSQAQEPPKGQPATKDNGTDTSEQKKEPYNHKEPAEKNPLPLQDQVRALVEQKDAKPNINEELEINRGLAAFTGQLARFTWWVAAFTCGLIVVGLLQLAAFVWQAKVLGHHSDLIKSSVEQMKLAVAAYQGFVQTSQGMLGLTRQSNDTTKEATVLMRESLILTHRPRLAIRKIALDQPGRGAVLTSRALSESPFASVADIKGHLVVANPANGRATIRDSYYRVITAGPPEEFPGGLTSDAAKGTPLLSPGHILEPGQSATTAFSGEGPSETKAEFLGQGLCFYLLGWMRYTDDLGIEREMGFCRCYDEALMRFTPVENPDYEYAD